ncbi:SMP-30/gluconolactonase/LRE family protein [Microcella frigidaquae]|uniref:Sugar lactone lactonase YvrE n=1 Tax=Microcella frigidaquae TaxID=424758 RepID=A0A840XNH3_9MICO|nr:SMP-30/gluconolactonase/LRE family protein [Microcella frigidaquae]MBB5618158.1 sugar lactone lactonase YvrE [Microcella frigidaquae]NHN44506.1 SMP-30/gluconolactonase/LRE family protein [Microcella frigidaquae]
MMLDGLGFPEALRWRDGALWFSDMFRSRVVRWRLDAPGFPAETVIDAATGGPAMPGGLGWLPGDDGHPGDLLVVDCLERRVLRVPLDAAGRAAGAPLVHADLSAVMSHSANDMHVDPDGTAWVGGYGFDPEADEPVASPLVRVHPDGGIDVTEATFVFPNGCERDASGALLVAETFADRVSAFVMPAASHGADGAEVVRFAAGSGPDGLSIAPDGTVYVALAFAGALARVDRGAAADAEPAIVYRPEPIATGPGAGPLGVYDCAVLGDTGRIAVAMASLDEPLAERVDTGRIVILDRKTLS